jgi:hypothetical protein
MAGIVSGSRDVEIAACGVEFDAGADGQGKGGAFVSDWQAGEDRYAEGRKHVPEDRQRACLIT